MFFLYLRFLAPLGILAYLIKKNPFYTSYPVMLPFMIIAWFIVFYRMVKYSRLTNHMVHMILMDPTGTELTFIYQNQWLRRLRADRIDQTLMIQQLANPP